jgi:homoaconitate hydratase
MARIQPWFRSFKKVANSRCFATTVDSKVPQTFIEKVVQKYALGLQPGQVVRAGDYVMIRPEHVMSHDNTGPVITKCVQSNHTQLTLTLSQ